MASSTPGGFALFETALGCCGVAWRGRRISAVVLPAGDADRMRTRLRRRAAGPERRPPAEVARACERMTALLAGESSDLHAVEIDETDIPEFDRDVYSIARSVPCGETITYGEIATRLGDPSLARDVGAALGRNPTPLVVPCHRVVAADGRLGGFSAPGGRDTKRRLLEIEWAIGEPAPTLFTA